MKKITIFLLFILYFQSGFTIEEKPIILGRTIKERIAHLGTKEYPIYVGNRLTADKYIYGVPIDIDSQEKVTKDTFPYERNLELIRDILVALNDIPSVRPYYSDFPVRIENLGLSVSFVDEKKVRRCSPYITLVENFHTPILRFRVDKPNPNPYSSYYITADEFDIMIPEKYLPPKEGWPVPRVKVHSPATKPFFWDNNSQVVGWDYYKRLLFSSVRSLGEKNHLNFAVLGDTCESQQNPWQILGVGYWAQKNVTLEEAKKLAETIFQGFFSIVMNDRNYSKWTASFANREPGRRVEEVLGFRITFWDEYMNRVEEPYIAQIHCEKGVISYYTADEGQRLHKVYEEKVPIGVIEKTAWNKFVEYLQTKIW